MADPSITKPPDIPGNTQGNPGPSHVNKDRRTLPLWIDRHNKHGDAEYLLLQGINNAPLPRKPLMIGISIELAAGGPIASAISESRGTKYTLQVRNRSQAEKLLNMNKLTDDTPVQVTYHPTRNICRCVVTCWDMVETDIEEIKEYLEKQGVVDVRRISRRTQEGLINTGTMILTCKGTVPPKHVKFGALRVATRVFYPSPMLCFRCYSFGHTKTKCKGNTVCRNCSNVDESTEICDKPAYCKNCKQNHSPADRSCPAYKTEVEIIKIKTDEGLTYPEAKEAYKSRVTKSKGTYANALQQRLTEAQAKNDEIIALTNLVKQKDEANKLLLNENQELRKQVTELQQTLNQVLEGQKRLQEQFRQHVQQSQQHNQEKNLRDQSQSKKQIPEQPSGTNSTENHRILTRSQKRSELQSNNKDAEKDSQNAHKKRTVPKLSGKPPKLHKSEELNLSFSNDESDTTLHTNATDDLSMRNFSDDEMAEIDS